MGRCYSFLADSVCVLDQIMHLYTIRLDSHNHYCIWYMTRYTISVTYRSCFRLCVNADRMKYSPPGDVNHVILHVTSGVLRQPQNFQKCSSPSLSAWDFSLYHHPDNPYLLALLFIICEGQLLLTHPGHRLVDLSLPRAHRALRSASSPYLIDVIDRRRYG